MKASIVSASIVSAFGMTAIDRLALTVSKDREARHTLIVEQVGYIVALALVHAAPKGIGSPADWKRLAEVFTKAKMVNYAEHCAAFEQALKGKLRKVAEWDDAVTKGFEIAVAAFTGCAPRTYTAEQLAERETKRAAKKAEAKKAEKQAAREAREQAHAAEEAVYKRGFADGVASVTAPTLTAQIVADLIRAGSFGADVSVIRDALTVAPASVPALTA